MADDLDPAVLAKAISSDRWSVLTRTGLDRAAIGTWDPGLVRKPRLVVPIDVQALYVPEGSRETFVQVPLALTTPDGADPAPPPPPLGKGANRPPGVHLHWAMPDALLKGTLADDPAGRLGLRPLPNRWVVLRIVAPVGADRTVVRGWVVEADTSRVTAIEKWSEGAADGEPAPGKVIAPKDLNGGAGGGVSWTAGYDAAINRFALHDPLDDVADIAPRGAFKDLATYLVAGWWSEPSFDPLDPARSSRGLATILGELRWRAAPDLGGLSHYIAAADKEEQSRARFGLEAKDRVAIVEAPGAEPASPILADKAGAKVFLPEGARYVATRPRVVYSTLLHGVVHGVPVGGAVVADNRPDAGSVDIAVAPQIGDAVASLSAIGLGASDPDERAEAERLIAALANEMIARLGEANGAVDIEERSHAGSFGAVPGDGGADERIVDRGGPENLVTGRAARNRFQAGKTPNKVHALAAELTWTTKKQGAIRPFDTEVRSLARLWEKPGAPPVAPVARIVRRPGPRYHRTLEPVVAIRNAKRSLRHREDGRGSPDGMLHCRWPSQVPTGIGDSIVGAELVGQFPSGALPPEVRRLAANAVAFDPYVAPWIADSAARRKAVAAGVVFNRLKAETALRFSKDGIYDGAVPAFRTASGRPGPKEAEIAGQLRRFSLADGVDAAPVAVTAWSQPWSPIWFEWEAELFVDDRLDGWSLGQVDLETSSEKPGAARRTVSGRSPINVGAARALVDAIAAWIKLEEQRDVEGEGEADDAVAKDLATVMGHLRLVDMSSASMFGILAHLLGLPPAPDGQIQVRTGAGIEKLVPVDVPTLLFSGRLRLARARIVDAFGRTLDLDPARTVFPARDTLPEAKAMRLPPRLARPARWSFRFADPGDPSELPAEATIDQAEPALMINPVAGFLLPDLIDEALEVFDAAGKPLGQLMHEPIGGGVTWEIAPGRPGPADSGPLFDLTARQLPLGRFAAAMVEADARARDGLALPAGAESALSAFLRAIDTTLWTVDSFAALGTPHIAGLVGRPMALVRASLRLQVKDDLGDLDLTDPEIRAAREAAYADLSDRGFTVRIGELTRDDDGVYGYFVNDAYGRFHLVDRLVRDQAFESGRRRGHFGLLGAAPQVPTVRPIDHPYIIAEDELVLHAGQIVRLTLLMHPAGKVHLTSGILPRKSLQLARDWVNPGLERMAPSARIGPVLIDPDKVRLPRIASFGTDQTWTRRDTPFTWRDDPILAATQTALLPDMPARVEEGYVRITPVPPEGEGS